MQCLDTCCRPSLPWVCSIPMPRQQGFAPEFAKKTGMADVPPHIAHAVSLLSVLLFAHPLNRRLAGGQSRRRQFLGRRCRGSASRGGGGQGAVEDP